MNDSTSKKFIRDEILHLRNAMSRKVHLQKSRTISEILYSLDYYKTAEIIFSYISFRSEVDTKSINLHALSDGKKVAVPRVQGELMDFYYINDYDDLEKGYFGISEPKPYTSKAEDTKNVLVLVPGVVFDENLHRIGYGKGYYDKYFKQHIGCFTKAALAYDYQVLDVIPADTYDICMDMIITNDRIIR